MDENNMKASKNGREKGKGKHEWPRKGQYSKK